MRATQRSCRNPFNPACVTAGSKTQRIEGRAPGIIPRNREFSRAARQAVLRYHQPMRTFQLRFLMAAVALATVAMTVVAAQQKPAPAAAAMPTVTVYKSPT
jgi:hypothetical protein